MTTVVDAAGAPAAIGPYSQAAIAGGFIFVSGQLPIVPETGLIEGADAAAQARRSLLNLKATLAAAGAGLEHVVKATVFLKDMDDFAAVNAVYAEFFTANFPARAAIQVARLPKDALVEIEAVAYKE